MAILPNLSASATYAFRPRVVSEMPDYSLMTADQFPGFEPKIRLVMDNAYHSTSFEGSTHSFLHDSFQVSSYTLIHRPTSYGLAIRHLSSLEEVTLIGLFAQCIKDSVDEVFMDGMDSVFSKRITTLLIQHGDTGVSALARVLKAGDVDAETSGEILRIIGSLNESKSHYSRLWLLLDQLKSSDPRTRDAATLGLASLDDTIALPPLHIALMTEESALLQKNILLVIQQLEQA